MPTTEVLEVCEMEMQEALEKMDNNFKRVRTGRLTSEVFDPIQAEYYGAYTPINQMASLTSSDASTILIKPFERKALGDIEKAILKANMGLGVRNDGIALYVTSPPLNEERRKNLVAEAKEMSEQGKVAVRGVRRDGNKGLDGLKKDSDLSEDELKTAKSSVDDLLKKYEKEIDEKLATKSAEILKF
jgi:ribosome recycling factor